MYIVPKAYDTKYMRKIIYLLVVSFILLCIAYTDWRTRQIKNGTILAFLIAAAGLLLPYQTLTLSERAIGMIFAAMPLIIFDFALPGSFGGGDIKLLAAAGFVLGAEEGLRAFCIGFLSGGAYGAIMLLLHRKTRKDQLVLGPFLCAGIGIITFLKIT